MRYSALDFHELKAVKRFKYVTLHVIDIESMKSAALWIRARLGSSAWRSEGRSGPA